MLRSLVAVAVTLGLFAAAFILHIIGGATDQGWLFGLAVALVFLTAAGFPAIAGLIARRLDVVTVGLGGAIGVVLTASALWAANDRTWAFWIAVAAPCITIGVSVFLFALSSKLAALSRPASA